MKKLISWTKFFEEATDRHGESIKGEESEKTVAKKTIERIETLLVTPIGQD